MKRFVMGDIHGHFRALLQCFDRSGFNYDQDVLIQLGDVVDGHDGAYECVEELLKIKNLISIKGNHDVWFQEFITTGRHPKLWGHGGEATRRSYSKKRGKGTLTGNTKSTELRPEDIPERHQNFFNSQQLYCETHDDLLFVHAGFKPYLSLNQQGYHLYDDRSFWDEIKKYKNSTIPDKFGMLKAYRNIYIGHSPTTKSGTDQPIRLLNITNIDTGAAKGTKGRLTIMNLDTTEYWQSDQTD